MKKNGSSCLHSVQKIDWTYRRIINFVTMVFLEISGGFMTQRLTFKNSWLNFIKNGSIFRHFTFFIFVAFFLLEWSRYFSWFVFGQDAGGLSYCEFWFRIWHIIKLEKLECYWKRHHSLKLLILKFYLMPSNQYKIGFLTLKACNNFVLFHD